MYLNTHTHIHTEALQTGRDGEKIKYIDLVGSRESKWVEKADTQLQERDS